MITDAQQQEFKERGFLHIPDFYDVETEIKPIQLGVYKIIQHLIKKHNAPVEPKPFSSETFDDGFLELVKLDRKIGSEVYDAIKNIPAFVRLSSSHKNEQLFCQLRGTETPGIAYGGFGIRMDIPHEEQYRAPWHQEYPAQLRSPDGITFWTSLVPLLPEMGPVVFCPGSHKDGLVPVHTSDPDHPEKSNAYALIFENEQERIAKYPQESPIPKPGDLVVIDFLVFHRSGYNTGNRARWTVQMRYFNFDHPTGVNIGWSGSFAAGVNFGTVHPELIVQ